MEEALYEVASMRLFAGLSLDSAISDHTAIMNFHHLLEKHKLARKLFKEANINKYQIYQKFHQVKEQQK